MDLSLPFDNSFARLPDRFYVKLPPSEVCEPKLVKLNVDLAQTLGLDPASLETEAAISMFAGNHLPEGAEPLAMAYAGHQFGNWVPQLGDGRAVLLGEVVGPDGIRRDIQLKGSGRTPFSRMGDGRAVLGPVLREYIVSEAMHAMGIPTTRALAAATTGERVIREGVLPGAVLTRVAKAHVRVGSFQFFAARQDHEALRILADYMIERCYPDAGNSDNRYRAFLDKVVSAQALLIAKWMSVGFIHGVMNTDNMSIAGETIDYGPCAFMDDFDPVKVFSSIDQTSRYAFARQPDMAHWNLACLARALLPILDENEERAIAQGQEAIDSFPQAFSEAWIKHSNAKLGLREVQEGDDLNFHELLKILAESGADFTNTFRSLSDDPNDLETLTSALGQSNRLQAWWSTYQERLALEPVERDERIAAMKAVNPAFIPRNHRIQEVIDAAYSGNFALFEKLTTILKQPFDDQPENEEFNAPPLANEVVTQTFCGT